jgi:ComF family protein
MQRLFKKILEIIFPNRCLACNKMIGAEGLFCNEDWQKLQFITEPKCKICSQPFVTEIDASLTSNSIANKNNQQNHSLLCLKCLTTKPSYDTSITIFCYNDLLKKIIGDMKYRDATQLSKKFGKMLWQKIAPEIQNYDLIIAVPLHKIRLRERKFNQAILLVKAILQSANNAQKNVHHIKNHLPKFYPDILLRTKYTTAQVKLDRKMRQENLRGIFAINKKYCDAIKGSSVLLVDDVTTTGATLDNCALALKEAGANKVTIATIARTPLG